MLVPIETANGFSDQMFRNTDTNSVINLRDFVDYETSVPVHDMQHDIRIEEEHTVTGWLFTCASWPYEGYVSQVVTLIDHSGWVYATAMLSRLLLMRDHEMSDEQRRLGGLFTAFVPKAQLPWCVRFQEAPGESSGLRIHLRGKRRRSVTGR